MSFVPLIWIAIGGSFAVVWLIHYIPIHSTAFGRSWSPRLAFCRLLEPLDAAMTLFLVCGAWVGLTSAVIGIGMMVYNVTTGIGISMGVLITKKVLLPRWKASYQRLLADRASVMI